jgi:hydrogenase expression/formation protein HypE
MRPQKILLAHGSGGSMMHALIRDLLLKELNNPILEELSDSASISLKERIAFTTDSFVVTPLFFPGGDIGKLAVCGTANDLVMQGAMPEYLSLALIIEEGLEYNILEKIVRSIALQAARIGSRVVAGDLKVVERGAADKIFINTSGLGRIIKKSSLSLRNVRMGDKIILSGNIGQHGLAVLAKRKGLDLGFDIQSDCAALKDLIMPVFLKTEAIQFMRDPTRGGVATTLNEIVAGLELGIVIEEERIPVSKKVRVACELLGMDPLYVANEGRAILIVRDCAANNVVKLLRRHPLGRYAQIIGSVVKNFPGQVVMNTMLGTERLVEMLVSEPLPRIC